MAHRRELKLPTRFGQRHAGSAPAGVKVTVIDYASDFVEMQGALDLDSFLLGHRREGTAVRWIDVAGLSDLKAIEALARKYELHPLAVEDLLNLETRPKVDAYAGGEPGLSARLFIVTRMLELKNDRLESEQISVFLGHKTVLTFQETPGDVWDPIRQRLNAKGSRLRTGDASFLVYSLLDAIVDHVFPILERYGDRLESMETRVLIGRNSEVLREIHRLKRELLLLRRALWPMRDVVHQIQTERHECLSEETNTYMSDLHSHIVQAMDILETYREVVAGLAETYLSAVNNRLNEVMMALTVVSVIFVPLNFLAGVFGMNFEAFPWKSPWGFPAFLTGCALLAGAMLYQFRRRGWL